LYQYSVIGAGEGYKVGVSLKLQAIPEDCELLIKARSNREIAEWLQFFHLFADGDDYPPDDSAGVFVYEAVQTLVRQRPGLIQRYFYDGPRVWDAILYLLDVENWPNDWSNDTSLVNRAINGSEPVHPDANATQGNPIGFVPAQEVHAIADYFDTVTYEHIHEHYDPVHMSEIGVYKIVSVHDETRFQNIWDGFVGIRNLYREAAAHNEAVITVID